MKDFDTFGVMLDCSRNAVMTPAALKRYMTILAKLGYNQLQLYMEDTYEVEGEPWFGYLRGRYTQEELRDLDDCAASLGIELVPCVQTLAHLNAALRWPPYERIKDIDDILLVGEERTYQLIENMFASLRACFRTKKIHIGMDEAHHLGRGRYFDRHGSVPAGDVLLGHLRKVCELADKYGFEPMMWSDMFFRIAGGYEGKLGAVDESVRALIPGNVSLVYWDYYRTKKAGYVERIRGHKKLTDRVVFAGGAWEWIGFTAHNEYSLRTTKAALAACRQEGVRDVFLTLWGDDGGEASFFGVLPALGYAACLAQGITDRKEIEARFYEATGVAFRDMMLLDLPDKTERVYKPVNPSKYLLFNDCFMGILETASRPEDNATYASHARRLSRAAKRAGEYAYLFDAAAKLCRALSLKANLCADTRAVYASGDRAAFDALIQRYDRTIRAVDDFTRAFRAQWMAENKPHGFDVQDIRLGGLKERLRSCRDRLRDYAEGRVDSLPELEEELLPFRSGPNYCNTWRLIATPNVMSHN